MINILRITQYFPWVKELQKKKMLNANFIKRIYSVGQMVRNFLESVSCNPITNLAAVGREFSKIKGAEQTDVHMSFLCAIMQTMHSKTYS
jgi:hypothetical protein